MNWVEKKKCTQNENGTKKNAESELELEMDRELK